MTLRKSGRILVSEADIDRHGFGGCNAQCHQPTQKGNSCAAHCTTIAIRELTGESISQTFTENDLWNRIKFRGDEGELSEQLADKKNSDPRLIVAAVNDVWRGRVRATLY